MLDHYHYRRWYRTTTRTDFCCIHLQLNQHLTAFLQHHKHKERTASGGMYGQGYVVIYVPKRPWPMNEITAFLQYHKHKEKTASGRIYGPKLYSHIHPQTPITYKQDNCHTNTPTNTTPLLALHCHLNDPIASTILLPTQTMIVLICIQFIN